MSNLLTRRAFMGASAAGVSVLALGGCSETSDAYRKALAEMTSPLPATPEVTDLVRYATLAANGHNTQPWKVALGNDALDILPDFSRRTAAVDPDDHHLFASLGCAAENLSIAARARGLSGEAGFEPAGDGRVRIDLTKSDRQETELFAAIPARQCSRVAYDRKKVPADVLARLGAAAQHHAVDTIFISDDKGTEDLLALVLEGNSRQMDDPAFVAELKDWLRFNPETVMASRDGLYSASSGNPVLPSWLGSIMFDIAFTKQSENDKYAEQIRSSSGLVVFVAQSNDPRGWVQAGQAYQRFALQATADGLKNAFLNQAVEVPEVRKDLQSHLGLGDRRPNLVVRFGYGPAMPRSLRRPVKDVMV